MGTHPIFESDFDCLTEKTKMLRKLLPRLWAPQIRSINGEQTLNSVIQKQLSEKDAKELFSLIDQNQDGILQARELYQALSHNIEGLESLILTLLDDVVIDSEKMTFPDFLIFVSRRKSGNGVLKLFDEYDKDGSHRLDKYEVQYWHENHGKYITIRQAQKIIDQMDFNGDGMIEYDDFLATILARVLTIKLRELSNTNGE